jgi:hypothetical protein
MSDPAIRLALLDARTELYLRADWSPNWAAYVRANQLDIMACYRFCGIIAVTSCAFYGQCFDFADCDEPDAEPAAVIEVLDQDAETIVDLCAWPLSAPDRFATGFGAAALLGADRVTNAATYYAGQFLQAYRTPLAWLRAGCAGAVILDPIAARFALSRARGPIAGEDLEHAEQIQRLTLFPAARILAPLAAA